VVGIDDLEPSISISLTPASDSAGESGVDVLYTVAVTNHSAEAVTVDAIADSDAGDLDGVGTCVAGGVIAGSGVYTCTFTGIVDGTPGGTVTREVMVAASDNEGNDASASASAGVSITDTLPAITVEKISLTGSSFNEPQSAVTFSVRVINETQEPVTLSSLSDDQFGSLNNVGGCATGRTVAGNARYTCTFTKILTGNAGDIHTNIVTAGVEDDEGNTASASSAPLAIEVLDVVPSIAVTKTARPPTIDEEAETDVAFTVAVRNLSLEPVVLEGLLDDVAGNVDGTGTCAVGGTIEPGASYTCEFVISITLDALETHTNTVTATALDDEGNSDIESGSATVRGRDLLPAVSVAVSAAPGSVEAPGGVVEFSVTVTNTSREGATLLSLSDSVFGDLHGQGNCLADGTGSEIPPGGFYTCGFTGSVAGYSDRGHASTLTAMVLDDDLNPATAQSVASVTIFGVPESFALTFPEAAAFGQGWWFTPWFGFLYGDGFPWIYHETLGWLYVSGTGGEFLWMFSLHSELGWLGTSAELFPFVWSASRGDWMYYLPDSNDPLWFYDFAAGDWIAITEAGL
jgi:hypothetical protein